MNRYAFLSRLMIIAGFFLAGSGGFALESARLDLGFENARPQWSTSAFGRLPEIWGSQVRPGSAEFKREIFMRYGLTFELELDALPIGLVETRAKTGLLGKPGLVVSCQFCHSSKVSGQFFVGAPNVFADLQRFVDDMNRVEGIPENTFFRWNLPRNSFVNSSDYSGRIAVLVRAKAYPTIDLLKLVSVFREDTPGPLRDFNRKFLLNEGPWDPRPDSEGHPQDPRTGPWDPQVKTQPWFNYRYKKAESGGHTLWVDGSFHGNPGSATYSLTHTLKTDGSDYKENEDRFFRQVLPDFARLEPPPFPGRSNLDQAKVTRGLAVYRQSCQSCHGRFERAGAGFALEYFPKRVISREQVGTDPLRASYNFSYAAEIPGSYLDGQLVPTFGYMAQPLVGIWARAPFLHNGSIPTLRQLLRPEERIRKFGVDPDPDGKNYDSVSLGWKTRDLSGLSNTEIRALLSANPYLRAYVPGLYDLRNDEASRHWDKGMGNDGHDFGSDLNEGQVGDLLEFLKEL